VVARDIDSEDEERGFASGHMYLIVSNLKQSHISVNPAQVPPLQIGVKKIDLPLVGYDG